MKNNFRSDGTEYFVQLLNFADIGVKVFDARNLRPDWTDPTADADQSLRSKSDKFGQEAAPDTSGAAGDNNDAVAVRAGERGGINRQPALRNRLEACELGGPRLSRCFHQSRRDRSQRFQPFSESRGRPGGTAAIRDAMASSRVIVSSSICSPLGHGGDSWRVKPRHLFQQQLCCGDARQNTDPAEQPGALIWARGRSTDAVQRDHDSVRPWAANVSGTRIRTTMSVGKNCLKRFG